MIINKVFQGGLNLDTQDYRLPDGDYPYALNVTKDAQGVGQDFVVSNIMGNREVAYTLPTGINKCIGKFNDNVRNRIYYFVWNSTTKHSVLYYNGSNDTIVKLLENITDTDGIDVLKFNPSNYVNSVDVLYRDEIIEGDLLFFNDGLNPPRVINVNTTYPIWKEEYLNVAKAPPQMPPKVVYKNDINATANNLRNSLFQFTYRFVYANFEKSVWSSKSNTPLPFDNPLTPTNDFTRNSAIGVYVSTGSEEVKKIEVGFRFFTQGVTSTWYLIDSFDKDELGLSDNDIFTFDFKNDGLYVPIDELSAIQLQDYVPQRANAGTLLNGNTPIYGGIVEGYDKVDADMQVDIQAANPSITYDFAGSGTINIFIGNVVPASTTYSVSFDYVSNAAGDASPKNVSYISSGSGTDTQEDIAINLAALLSGNNISAQHLGGGIIRVQTINGINGTISNVSVGVSGATTIPFYTDFAGTLLFATIQGVDSGASGNILKVYMDGAVANGDTLLNAKGNYNVVALDSSGNAIGASFTVSTNQETITNILAGLQGILISNGWTFVSLQNNILTMSRATTAIIAASGIKEIGSSPNQTTAQFAYPYKAGGELGVMYFDAQGRTNGATISADSEFSTPEKGSAQFPLIELVIRHRPPTWAKYYTIVRTTNTTYEKRLDWVSNSAFSDTSSNVVGNQFAYIGINNIDAYNEQQSGTRGIVGYSFQQGDRIRFLGRYNDANTLTPNFTIRDYEVVGTEVNPVINGVVRQGTFVKINYPTNDIGADLNFDGSQNFQKYRILLYAISKRAESGRNIYFEFGKSYGIGNAGQANAYHLGEVSQSIDLSTPARISVSNGDLIFRERKVLVGQEYDFVGGNRGQTNAFETTPINVPSVINVNDYRLAGQQALAAGLGAGQYPTFANDDCIFRNLSTTRSISVRVRYTLPITTNKTASLNVYVKLANNSGVTAQKIVFDVPLMSTAEVYSIVVDRIILVPPSTKMFLLTGFEGVAPTISIGTFDFRIDVLDTIQIPIIEQGFSDLFNIVANSNGRPTTFDENAKNQYFPTMVRFGQAYQQDTNINGTNNFIFDNFDTYDRGYGDIQRFHVRERYLKVYQKRKVGNVPILTQIVKDVTGNPLQAESDRLINKIQYYTGDYGIGDCPNSLAWNNFQDYFVDDFRGVVCRLSQNGIEPISIIYKTNAFFVTNLKAFRKELNNGIVPIGETYLGDPTVLGEFDAATNKYVVALQEIKRYSNPTTLVFQQESFTLAFDERLNIFESFYSWKPEQMACLGTLLVSFKNGRFWKHDNPTYCNFYGVQYNAEISGVFGSTLPFKKTFLSVSEVGNVVWNCPEIETDTTTYGTTKQSSNIPTALFARKEGQYHAPFRRDANSQGGLNNGWTLKGAYIKIKFRATNPNNFVFLNYVGVRVIDSPLNTR